MQSSQMLWQNYHAAVQAGKTDLAKQILRSLQNYKGNPPPAPGGCAKCRKRFF